MLFEFELQIISNLLLAPRPRLVVRPSLSCFYLLPLRTPAGLELFQIILNTAHPNISTHLALSASSFSRFCVCKVLVCVWLARAGCGTQDWFSLNISTNQGPRTLRRPVGKCRSAFDWWHATIFFRLRAHSSLPAEGRWPSFRRCDTHWHSLALIGWIFNTLDLNQLESNVAISVCLGSRQFPVRNISY